MTRPRRNPASGAQLVVLPLARDLVIYNVTLDDEPASPVDGKQRYIAQLSVDSHYAHFLDRLGISIRDGARRVTLSAFVHRRTGAVEYGIAHIDSRVVKTERVLDEYGPVVDWFAELYRRAPRPLPSGETYAVRDFPEIGSEARANPITATHEMGRNWAEGTLRRPMYPYWRTAKVWRRGSLSLDGRRVPLTVKRVESPVTPFRVKHASLLWYLGPVGAPLAVGQLSDMGDALIVDAAAVRPDMQRRGIYRAVLVALRQLLGEPIESDACMTEGAIRAWKRAGATETRRAGFGVMRLTRRAKARANPASLPARLYVTNTADERGTTYKVIDGIDGTFVWLSASDMTPSLGHVAIFAPYRSSTRGPYRFALTGLVDRKTGDIRWDGGLDEINRTTADILDKYGAVIDAMLKIAADAPPPLEGGQPYLLNDFPRVPR